MMHQMLSEQSDLGEEQVSCIVCGATYFHSEWSFCSGRTDLVHGSDLIDFHALDNCSAFDETGTCEHLARTAIDCDCSLCDS
jgi:hypothetical protein